ncbi:hypothetical protein [Paenibacillus faecalis]|uniref:hypothetical protein n=1 Tax=Paenibacillus faecalis TaxID=2079532 RepID=UPI000D0F081C|nr:hypothetical protein [Paenibacillus faecalis]
MRHQHKRRQKRATAAILAAFLFVGATGCGDQELGNTESDASYEEKEEISTTDSRKPGEVYIELLEKYESKELTYNTFLNDYDEYSEQAIPRDDFKGMLREALADNVVDLDESEVLTDIVEVIGDYDEYASKTKEAYNEYVLKRGPQPEKIDSVGEPAKADRIDFDTEGHLAAAKKYYENFAISEQEWLNKVAAESMNELKNLVNGLSDSEWKALQPSYESISKDFYDAPNAMLSLFANEVDAYRATH